nr:ATP-binding protein [Kofleriaceae bacterium]
MTEPELVTLDTCAREPIHIPGSIQPHGVLFACRGADLVVDQVSRNVETLVGAPVDAVLQRPLAATLGRAAEPLAAAFRDPSRLAESNPRRIDIHDRVFDAVLHVAAGGQHVVELETGASELAVGFDPHLRAATMRLQRATAVDELCRIAAHEVRAITGFDRVMIYRFDKLWNGEVVAEAKRDDLESFFGLHYPASDIPEQARRLYTLNWLRFIADVSYAPVPVVPPRAEPLDMSFGVLRSVSPIHIEYLKNMGVSASMSVSLVHDGTLIGLIACHHYSGPRLVSFRARDTAEFVGRTLSWNLRLLEDRDRAARARVYVQRELEVVRRISDAHDFLIGLASNELLGIVDASGAEIVLQDGRRRIGDCPPQAATEQLVAWLAGNGHDVFATEHAAGTIPVALGDHGAGVLAVAISRELREYLLWFRAPTERTVNWAGDPHKVLVANAPGAPPRLSPRGSFALWRETMHDFAAPWDDTAIEAAANLRSTLLSGVRVRASELRAYNQRLLEADRAKDDFIATVSHELRTPLNAIAGWAELLANPTTQSADRLAKGIGVIKRNAAVQTQLVDDLLDVSRMVSGKLALDLTTLNLHDLVVEVLASVEVAVAAKGLRLKRVLDPGTSQVLGDATRLRQVIANLVNNAIKFTPKGGTITVMLRRVDSDIELCVQDTGKGIDRDFLPLVFDVFRQADSGMNRRAAGLGIGLAIARKLVELHGGRITAASDGDGKGALFRVHIPLASVHLKNDTPPEGIDAQAAPLAGVHALVVEDELDSRELLCHIITVAGARCTEMASAGEALALLASGSSFGILISDIGMPGVDGLQFIRELRARGADAGGRIPAIALTAYTRTADRSAALNAGFDAHLGKPVDPNELIAVISRLIDRSRR